MLSPSPPPFGGGPLLSGYLSIEVNGTVRTFGIVHYIVGVRC